MIGDVTIVDIIDNLVYRESLVYYSFMFSDSIDQTT